MVKKISTYRNVIFILAFLFVLMNAGAQNLTRPNVMGPGGVKVNSYTGNMFMQRTDLFIAGRTPLDISFSYNSADRHINIGYGNGWIFRYGMRIIEEHDSALVIREDGRRDVFTPGLVNILRSPKGIFDTLKRLSPGVYLLRSKDGTKYFFENSAHKRVTKIEDRNGNALSFSYTDSLISTITDGAGRTVQMSYSAGNLTSLSEANGTPTRNFTFEYDNAANLTRVTDPMGFTTEYTYVVNGPINSVKDKNANVVDIVYNENFSVREIISCLTKQTITYNLLSNTSFITELVGGSNQITSYKYDVAGNLIQRTGHCCGYNIKFQYDQDNNVSQLTDANGNAYTYTYDGWGNVLSETDPLGHTRLYTYESVYNQIASITDKNGNQTSYSYDAQGNLIEVHKPGNITESYTYAGNGDRLSFTDGRGNTTSFTYDANGNPATVSKPLGSAMSYSYDPKGRKVSQTDALSHTTTYSYDLLDRLLTVTDPLNHQNTSTYDHNGNARSFTDANNHTRNFEYDALDRLVKITNALGKSTHLTYDEKGNLLDSTDENGITKKYVYDNFDRPIVETNGAGEITQYSYDGNGNMISKNSPNGDNILMSYDAANNLVSANDQLGALKTFTYDHYGNKITEKDGNGNTTTYTYDQLNRLVSVTDALGHSVTYSYDPNSNQLTVTDKNGHTTSYVYDALNRQTTKTDASGNATHYGYDAQNNLTSVTDANSHTTGYTHDAVNRVTGINYANSTSKHYSYDAVGNLQSRTDGNGATTQYSYDNADRLIKRDYPGSNDDIYTYDDAGRMLTANNSNATISFSYDAANRVTSETLNGKTTSYQYSVGSKNIIMTYPGGRVTEHDKDVRDRLMAIKEGSGSIAEFDYDPADRNTWIKYQNGTSSTISYDATNNIASILGNPGGFLNLNYSYDNQGNELFEKKIHDPGRSEKFDYDNLDRVTNFKKGTLTGNSINSPVRQAMYDYDGVGNRNSMNLNSNLTSYVANAVNAYSSVNDGSAITPGYDNNGNLTYDGVYTYSYDVQNHLLGVSGATSASYLYDALERRIRKTVNGVSTNYYYSSLQVIEERDLLDNIKATYVYGRGLDQAITMKRGDTSYFYHYNNLGSVYSVSNAAGKVVESYEYDPFGEIFIFDSLHNSIPVSSIGNVSSFTGREFDAETKNYYYRSRAYNSKWGRFGQRDPLEITADISFYSYVSNNPVNTTDPLGLEGATGGTGQPYNSNGNVPNPPASDPSASEIEFQMRRQQEEEKRKKEEQRKELDEYDRKFREEQKEKCRQDPSKCKPKFTPGHPKSCGGVIG